MTLDPQTYSCQDDQCDLTGFVLAAVHNSLAGAFELLAENRTRPSTPPGEARPFEVLIQCPGPGGDGHAHKVICTGTYTI